MLVDGEAQSGHPFAHMPVIVNISREHSVTLWKLDDVIILCSDRGFRTSTQPVSME